MLYAFARFLIVGFFIASLHPASWLLVSCYIYFDFPHQHVFVCVFPCPHSSLPSYLECLARTAVIDLSCWVCPTYLSYFNSVTISNSHGYSLFLPLVMQVKLGHIYWWRRSQSLPHPTPKMASFRLDDCWFLHSFSKVWNIFFIEIQPHRISGHLCIRGVQTLASLADILFASGDQVASWPCLQPVHMYSQGTGILGSRNPTASWWRISCWGIFWSGACKVFGRGGIGS